MPLPLFQSDFACASNSNVTYAFVGEQPSWITLDEEAREVKAQIDALEPEVTSQKVKMKASLEDTETEFSFTLYFITEPKQEPVEATLLSNLTN